MPGFQVKETSLPSTVKLIHGDCLDVLRKMDRKKTVVLTDPPYGIEYDASASSQQGIQKFKPINGDAVRFNPKPFLDFADVLMWGADNYCDLLPPKTGLSGIGQWYVWDKGEKNGMGVQIAEAEFAWHKKGTKSRIFRHLWSGGYRASETRTRSVHPNQKPVALMEWCLSFLPENATVLDPYMGSGTTGVACVMTGRNFIGIEIDENYFKIAERRIKGAPRRAT